MLYTARLMMACMQIPQPDKEGNGASGNGSGRDLQAKGQGTQEEQEDVRESVAGVVQALTELASVQTPASVWLPSKHLTVQLSGKVGRVWDLTWLSQGARRAPSNVWRRAQSLQAAVEVIRRRVCTRRVTHSSQQPAHAAGFVLQCTNCQRAALFSQTMKA